MDMLKGTYSRVGAHSDARVAASVAIGPTIRHMRRSKARAMLDAAYSKGIGRRFNKDNGVWEGKWVVEPPTLSNPDWLAQGRSKRAYTVK